MIAEAVYDLLSTDDDIAAIVGERIYPVAFTQSEQFPALTYNIKRGFGLECRDPSNKTKSKLLEIAILASTAYELQTLAELLDAKLANYSGTHAGYYLQVEPNDDDFDEDASDINALFKRLQFDLTITKL